MTFKKIKYFIISLTVLAIVVLLALFLVKKNLFTTQETTNRAAVIKQIQSLSRLETASYTIEKIIDKGSSGGNAIQRLLFGDKILLIAHGQANAGFDLELVSEKDIFVDGKNLRVKLPKPQILTVTLDNTKTRV